MPVPTEINNDFQASLNKKLIIEIIEMSDFSDVSDDELEEQNLRIYEQASAETASSSQSEFS